MVVFYFCKPGWGVFIGDFGEHSFDELVDSGVGFNEGFEFEYHGMQVGGGGGWDGCYYFVEPLFVGFLGWVHPLADSVVVEIISVSISFDMSASIFCK